ncbi:MAG: hypothetical protein ACYSR4_03500 [Planctomycetota bacterium]
MANGASAGQFAELKVDFALVHCPDTSTIRPESAKPGWWHWAAPGWADMYMHDMRWEDGSISPKPTGPGIDGTGVHACITTGSEGQLGLHMKDLCRDNLGGDGCPYGSPAGDPIANTWFYAVDWAGPEAADILLLLTDLPAGEYWLYSYHNHWEPCSQSTRNCLQCECGMPPMPSITANPLPSSPPPGYNGYSLPLGTGTGVTQIENAYNVWPTHYYSDEDLVPSLIKFQTDGSEVLIIYEADNTLWPDCARPGREGSRAILNAFRLQFLGEVVHAHMPSPTNGSVNVSPEVVLGWEAGGHAVWHDVYFGTDLGSVRDATTTSDPHNVYMGRQHVGDVDFDPTQTGFLKFNETYYWRVDEVNEPNVWTGDVWSFRIYEARAGSPTPVNGSKDVAQDVELGWSPGYAAVSHDVYFGTDFDDVNDADTSSPEYKGNQPLGADSYGPSGLALDSACYWRIDEVSNPATWKGDVWSFTTMNYAVIDDMESYETSSDLYGTWVDARRQLLPTGAVLWLGDYTSDPVHRGDKSMKYEYWTDMMQTGWALANYAEAYLPLPGDKRDWMQAGMKALTLYFFGDPDNDANDTEQMYVGVSDGSDTYAEVRYGDYREGEDTNDIKLAEWQEWNIELSDFNGVDLTDVSNLYIGFGNRNNPVPGGNGVVYFDDIRLYMPRCVAGLAPAADFASDCIVDLKDLSILGSQWQQPPGSPSADIAPEPRDGIVDWRDFAALADSWLAGQLWPEEE